MGRYQSLLHENEAAFRSMSPDVFNHVMHISMRDRYIYSSTPKVACSTILMTLQRLELRSPAFVHEPLHEIHNRGFSPLLYPMQVPSFRDLLNDPQFFKFCFVRNPYDRFISAYLNKVSGEKLLAPRFLSALGRTEGDISFDEFVQVVASERPGAMDLHYAPQSDLTFCSYLTYDFIGRFEQFNEGIDFVLSRIGQELSAYKVTVDVHKTGYKDYSKYLTQANVSALQMIYADDFRLFGYDPAPPT